MPVHTDLHIEALQAQFHARRTQAYHTQKEKPKLSEQTVQTDRVEISLSANMTVQAANGIMNDSVVEQINKALQEAGIDFKVEETQGGKIDVSPEGTARRIADFATSFFDAYKTNHASESGDVQLRGYMSLMRKAIEDGFQNARSFLKGITKLSEEIEKNIDETAALTNQYLDDFYKMAETDGRAETMVEV